MIVGGLLDGRYRGRKSVNAGSPVSAGETNTRGEKEQHRSGSWDAGRAEWQLGLGLVKRKESSLAVCRKRVFEAHPVGIPPAQQVDRWDRLSRDPMVESWSRASKTQSAGGGSQWESDGRHGGTGGRCLIGRPDACRAAVLHMPGGTMFASVQSGAGDMHSTRSPYLSRPLKHVDEHVELASLVTGPYNRIRPVARVAPEVVGRKLFHFHPVPLSHPPCAPIITSAALHHHCRRPPDSAFLLHSLDYNDNPAVTHKPVSIRCPDGSSKRERSCLLSDLSISQSGTITFRSLYRHVHHERKAESGTWKALPRHTESEQQAMERLNEARRVSAAQHKPTLYRSISPTLIELHVLSAKDARVLG
nr:hypothetical protein CFP56_74512 [Quercus suber]